MTNNTNTIDTSVEQEVKAPAYALGDTVEYLEGTYEVVEVLAEGIHLKNVHKPFNSTVVGCSELTQE